MFILNSRATYGYEKKNKMIPKKIYKKLAVLLPEGLITTSKYIELSREEFLFRPGDSVDFVYYIIEGQLRALRYQFDGKAAVIWLLMLLIWMLIHYQAV